MIIFLQIRYILTIIYSHLRHNGFLTEIAIFEILRNKEIFIMPF